MKATFLSVPMIMFCMVSLAQTATIKEYNKSFITYPYSDPNPVPSFTKIYPYFRYDGFTDRPIQKDWKVIELENDFIKVMILPEIGGKIWAAIEKSTNRPFIYYNHVVKFRDIAMRGPWTSGGIEANYGVIGHTPNCATPVDYTTKRNEDGSVSCIIGVLDLLTRTNWRIEINLPGDKAYFTTKSFWYNSTSLEQPYYHWMNAGLAAQGNLEFIYPGTKYLGHEGEYSNWPVNKTNGKKISFYEENDFGGYKSYHVFGKYTNFFGGYWHDKDFGMARYALHDDKAGKKIWIWGLSRQGMIWEKLLTDTDGQYVEVQSGRLFNQNAEKSSFTPFKHKSFAPYNSDQWTEYWYPVLHTKGFVEANEYGALNVKYEEGWLKIYFNPVQKISDNLIVRQGAKIIYNKKLSLTPLKTFADSIQVNTDPENIIVALGENKLVYQSSPGANNISRPVDAPRNFNWDNVYGLYLQGKEFADQKMYAQAEEKLKTALEKDADFLPALIKMEELLYRNMRYADACVVAKSALSIDTHDGAANYYYGLINAQLNNVVDAKDGFDVAALSLEYRSAAYTELSKLYLKEKDWNKALVYAAKAIDFNRYNIPAYEAEAVVYRYKNDSSQAVQVLDKILSFDQLNHFARFEKYLWHPSTENQKQFTAFIQNELPSQTYLELAVDYYSKGCMDEAEQVLRLSPSNIIIEYWLAFIQSKRQEDFSLQLKKATQSSPAFAFAFRFETAEILEWAIQQTDNWKPKYLLGLLYKDRSRIAESRELFHQLNNQPDYAPFYAARALLFWDVEKQTVLSDLTKALALDKQEWRYHKMLAEYHIQQQQNEKALAITESFYHLHPANYIMGMLYAKTLLLNKKYKDCDQVLSHLNIIPFEGATDGRELYRGAKLMQAVQQLKKKHYKTALQLIAAARNWPENLGVGKPYEQDVDERLEDWMSYYCYQQMGNTMQAQTFLQKIVRFNPKIENTVRNFIPANHLVSFWALEKTKNKQAAQNWLNEQMLRFSGDRTLLWVKAAAMHSPIDLDSDEKNVSQLVLEQLQ